MPSDDLESIIPPDVLAEMEAVYNEPYNFNTGRNPGEATVTTKGKAAAVMAASGADFDEIADVLGFGTPKQAELAVYRALAASYDSWDKQALKAKFDARFEMLWRGALRRSQTKGYYAREAAASTALKTLVEHVKFSGMAGADHVVHSPMAADIRVLIEKVTNIAIADLPDEVDVIEGHVVSEIEP